MLCTCQELLLMLMLVKVEDEKSFAKSDVDDNDVAQMENVEEPDQPNGPLGGVLLHYTLLREGVPSA